VVKLGGFVQAGPDFYDVPKVINGCSDLMVEVFGDAGRHARLAVGVNSLPADIALEVQAIIALHPA
jgi:enamine deaminase RidA (YjgF/YER057c/UK114 family)